MPSPTPTVIASPILAECSKIGHEYVVFAATEPVFASAGDIEGLDSAALGVHMAAATKLNAVTWGYDDEPSKELSDAAGRYGAALKVAADDYEANAHVSAPKADAVYVLFLEVREDYRTFADLTCHAGTGS